MDTADLNDRVDMAELLADIGFSDVDPDAEEQLLFCVFHNDSATPSFSVNLSKKVFHCFSSACGLKGSAVTLYALWKQITYEQAKQEIAYMPRRRSVDRIHQMLKSSGNTMPISRKMDILTAFVSLMPPLHSSPYGRIMRDRAISDATMKRYDFKAYDESVLSKFDPEELFRAGLLNVWKRPIFGAHPILFPFKVQGRVAFLQGRAVDNNPARSKYIGCRGTVPCLFNHDALATNPENVFITEGVIDAISLEEMGYGPAVGIVGTEGFKESWLSDFRGAKKTWVATDNDEAGRAASGKLVNAFRVANFQAEVFNFDATRKDINEWLMASKK